MKAVVKTQPGPGNVELMEMPEPEARADTVVIEVKAAGICGTDIHIYKGEYAIDPPVILGHEFSGVIVETGPEVTQFKPGDRVTVNPTAGRLCGQCRYCRLGAPYLCVDRASIGTGINGGFAGYCGVREDVVIRLPEHLDFDSGALCEPFACAVQAVVELTEILPGEVVVISGPGPIGLMCAMLAGMRGARVVMLGLSADGDRMEIARRVGAGTVVDVETEDPKEIVRDLTGGYGADVVIECTGANTAVTQGLELIKKLGRFTQVGLFGRPVQIDMDRIVTKEIRLQGSICHNWGTWERTMSYLEQDAFDLHPLISEKLPLIRWEEGFNRVINREGVKTLLSPDI